MVGRVGIILAWVSCVLCAQDGHIKVRLCDQHEHEITTCTLGEDIYADVIIQKVDDMREMPRLEGVDAREVLGQSVQQRMLVVNGVRSDEYCVRFHLRCMNPGERRVGPAHLVVGAHTLTAPSVRLRVRIPEAGVHERKNVTVGASPSAYWKVERQRGVRGQAIVADLIFEASDPQTVTGVDTSGLTVCGWQPRGDARWERDELSGVSVHRWRQPGVWVLPNDGYNILPAVRISYETHRKSRGWLIPLPFMHTQVVTAPVVLCEARVLSDEERGMGIGRDVQMRWVVPDEKLHVGAAVTLVRVITGIFSVDTFTVPLAEDAAGVARIYPAETVVRAVGDRQELRTDFAIQGMAVGCARIGGRQLRYYDPDQERTVVFDEPSVELEVHAGNVPVPSQEWGTHEEEQPVLTCPESPHVQEVSIQEDMIAPSELVEEPVIARRERVRNAAEWVWWMLFMLPLLWVGCTTLPHRVLWYRELCLRRQAREGQRRIARAVHAGVSDELFYVLVMSLWNELLEDLPGVTARERGYAWCVRYGMSEDATSFGELCDRLDRMRYGSVTVDIKELERVVSVWCTRFAQRRRVRL